MALPSSGPITASQINIELGRASSAPFSLGGAEERALAGKPSGSISFSDFHGKSSEISVTMSAGSSSVLKSLFDPGDWASETTKRVIIPAGLEFGDASRSYSIATTMTADGQAGSFGGRLILEIEGIVSGRGGSANGGVGGNAIFANLPGKNGQKLEIINRGTIRGGGGGGGKGGKGGNGTTSSTSREPSSGSNYNASGHVYWKTFDMGASYQASSAHWGSSEGEVGGGIGATSLVAGDYTYYRSTFVGSDPLPGGGTQSFYRIYRVKAVTVSTAGGAGGNGGVGQGYGTSAGAGANGSTGGANAGRGGKGGSGGGWGLQGSQGLTGSNGNASNGLAGSSGGAPGYAITNPENYTLTNSGTVQGRL